MKTGLFRLWAVGAAVFSMVLSGCGQRTVENEVPPPVAIGVPYVGPSEVVPVPIVTEVREPAVVAAPAPAFEAVAVPVSVPVATNVIAAAPAGAPAAVMLSPAMQEVVKMQQAGVSEAVILSYVTNSPTRFGLTSDQIIYLHDLGFSSDVTKTLIEHDAAVVSAKAQPAAAPILVTPSVAAPSALPPSYEAAQPVTTVAPTMVSTAASQPDSVDYFYSHLAPYGNWVQVDGYGLCWQPSAAMTDANWRPYADEGYWLWTDNGWYWYSYYTWGWAPFHYGRWSHHSRIGWFWVPDTYWGPSWVSWRESGDYCGWAPLPPEVVYVQGSGLRYHGAAITVGFDFGLTDFYYTFIPVGRFGERHPSRYYLPPGRRAPLFRESIVINRFDVDNRHELVHRGVEFDRVNRASPGLVQKATFKEAVLGAPAGPRPEHLEIRAEGVVVHRPVLPKDPPPSARQTPAQVKEQAGVLLPGVSGRPAARPAGPERRPEPAATATATPSVRLPAVQNPPPVVSSGSTRPLPATRPSGPAPSGSTAATMSTPDALAARAARPASPPTLTAPPARGTGLTGERQRPVTSTAVPSSPLPRTPAGPGVSTPAPVSPMSPPRTTIAPTVSTPRPVTPVGPTISTPRAVAPIAPLSSPATRSVATPSPSASAAPSRGSSLALPAPAASQPAPARSGGQGSAGGGGGGRGDDKKKN
jgi:hypothetical protein